MRNLAFGVFSAAVLALAAVPAAQAVTTTTGGALIVKEGQPTPDETNIFFDAKTNTASGVGHYGSQVGTPLFSFTSSTDLLNFANGFAQIDPVTGLINQLTVSSPTGYLFNDLVFQAQGPSGSAATDLTISASLKGATVGTVAISDIGSGANAFLTMIALGGLVDTFTFSSVSGIFQFKQFEVSGLSTVPLPPAAMLFGSAIVGLGLLSRRRRKINTLVG